MKSLVLTVVGLAGLFAATFVVIRLAGVLTVDDIRLVLDAASVVDPGYVITVVIALLFADLFIAMPTLTICILSGYFLGFLPGALAASAGLLSAGLAGYGISYRYGPALLSRIFRNEESLSEMQAIVSRHGVVALLLCRAVPILPEVCCCLAGANRMPPGRFLGGYLVASVPYAWIAAYAGSRSTLEQPMPGILTAIGITAVLWLCWCLIRRPGQGRCRS